MKSETGGAGQVSPGRGERISFRNLTFRFMAAAIAAGACAPAVVAAGAGLTEPRDLTAPWDANVAASVPKAAVRVPDANAPGFDMSASDVGERLTRLLLDKPEVPISLPMDMDKPAASAPLPAEGTMIVDRLCRMWSERNSYWLVLTFEPDPGRPANPLMPADDVERRVLPCELMEQMETLAARTPGTRFRVSGETTIFEGRAYILPTKVTVLPHESPSAVAPSLVQASAPKPATSPAAGGATSAPGSGQGSAKAPAARDKPGELTSDDLLQALLSENAGRPIQTVPVLPDSPKPASVAPTNPAVLSVPRGEMVADRLVRIVPDPQGRWWIAAFEADNTLQEPPMRLLPCAMLAKAMTMAGDARPGRMRIFRVSGKVTRYEGDRYLLLRKVMVELNLGQF